MRFLPPSELSTRLLDDYSPSPSTLDLSPAIAVTALPASNRLPPVSLCQSLALSDLESKFESIPTFAVDHVLLNRIS